MKRLAMRKLAFGGLLSAALTASPVFALQEAGVVTDDAAAAANSETTNAPEAEKGDTAKSEATDTKADTPKTLTLKPERLKLTTEISGKFDSDQSQTVSLEPETWSSLKLLEAVDHGAKVRKGESLLKLDLDSLERAVAEAERELEKAELELQGAELSLKAKKETQPLDVAAAERRFEEAAADLEYFLKVELPQDRKQVEESLENSRFNLEYAEEELNQLKQMYEADDMTEQTEEIILKRQERAVERAKSGLESAELRHDRTLEVTLPRREQSLRDATEKTLASREKTKVELQAGMRLAELDLVSKKLAVEAAQRKFNELKSDLEMLSSITAPIDGYVYYGSLEKGEWSNKEKIDAVMKPGGSLPGRSTLMTVVSPQVTHLHGTVTESNLRDVRPGLSGKVKATALPDKSIAAAVDTVSPVPVSSGQFGVVFRLEESAPGLVPGMSGKATLVTYDRADALMVPKAAVGGEDEDRFVLMKDGTKRPVEVGKSEGDKLEIVRGLSAGDEIREKAE